LDPGPADFGEIRAGGPAAGQLIKRVKEQFRMLPDNGLGYGLLRYLNAETGPVLAALRSPQIGFNYLGRFTGGPAAEGWGALGKARLSAEVDDDMPAAHVIEITGLVGDGPDGPELGLSLSWPPEILGEAGVQELADAWLAALEGLASYAAKPGAGGHTPSDLPLVALTQAQIDELEAEFDDLDTGGATP
jgi:non-ribosomal peptide synthase protein (TIGR01720 family)